VIPPTSENALTQFFWGQVVAGSNPVSPTVAMLQDIQGDGSGLVDAVGTDSVVDVSAVCWVGLGSGVADGGGAPSFVPNRPRRRAAPRGPIRPMRNALTGEN
jgi:hypothetical protein